MAEDKKVYRVHAAQGRLALGDNVRAGDLYTLESENNGDVIILTRVVIVPRSKMPTQE